MIALQSKKGTEHETEIPVLFDYRYPGAADRLRRECSGWRGFANVEKLDAEHDVLMIRPGGALRVQH